MKAISLRQPWASLIAWGCKRYEFRTWKPSPLLQGQRIAIHASRRPVRRAEIQTIITDLTYWPANVCLEPAAMDLLQKWVDDPGALPRCAVLCTAELSGWVRGDVVEAEYGGPKPGEWAADPPTWAWALTDVRRLPEPIEATGAQGFWDWIGSGVVGA